MPKLIYDPVADRYTLSGEDLHCGDCLTVMIGSTPVNTRIELDGCDQWYLVGTGLRGLALDGPEAHRE